MFVCFVFLRSEIFLDDSAFYKNNVVLLLLLLDCFHMIDLSAYAASSSMSQHLWKEIKWMQSLII